MFGRIVKNLCSIDKYKHALQGVQVTSQCMTEVPQSAGMITQMRFIHQSSGHGIVTWNSNPCERTVVAVVTGIRRGISTSTRNDNEVSSELAVPSPLMQHPFPSPKKEEQKTGPNKTVVQAVLKGIKQSPRKVNLVAALVRGMRVEDALMQMQVTVKKAAKTVYDVIHSARANAVHNHGLNGDRLIVAEAFVGKGFYKKVISYHAKGRHGIMHHPTCRLTVKVRELTPKEEADIARLRVQRFKKLSKREKRLVPHKLIETQWHWYRKPKNITSQSAVAA